eukprot:TRINITY_DN7561_c0_g1_i1.p1 TRINITY_DN7561_c0_g1~~TRINITY_DN7561_c0_g1_i1.p1  ORF type:complete len:275 (+),score=40.77 TRINITY_DN7561_c0_g1_i1:65-889(+)
MGAAKSRTSGDKEPKIAMLGLDAAGKTTILYKLRLGEVVTTIPTIGMNIETVEGKGWKFVCWDVGGKEKIRTLWRPYLAGVTALVFVVDSNDHDRIDEARQELTKSLAMAPDAVVLVFANKQDLPGAMSPQEVADQLQLAQLTSHSWHIQGSCATSGEGLQEGLEMIQELITWGTPGPEVIATLQATPAEHDVVVLSCLNVAGAELASMELKQKQLQEPFGALRQELAERLGTKPRQLKLVLSDGAMLSNDMDAKLTCEALGFTSRKEGKCVVM